MPALRLIFRKYPSVFPADRDYLIAWRQHLPTVVGRPTRRAPCPCLPRRCSRPNQARGTDPSLPSTRPSAETAASRRSNRSPDRSGQRSQTSLAPVGPPSPSEAALDHQPAQIRLSRTHHHDLTVEDHPRRQRLEEPRPGIATDSHNVVGRRIDPMGRPGCPRRDLLRPHES